MWLKGWRSVEYLCQYITCRVTDWSCSARSVFCHSNFLKELGIRAYLSLEKQCSGGGSLLTESRAKNALVLQAEARKSELEMLLSVNLVRRQQELQAQLLASDTQGLMEDLAVKRQELKDAKAAVDETTRQLKCKLHRWYAHCQLFGRQF